MTGACANGRGVRCTEIEDRVLAGLKDKLMAPETAAEAMQAYAEETNRRNRERRASGEADRRELAAIGKKIRAMVAVIEDGGYARGMMDRVRELEAREDELNERLAAGLADLPDIHSHIAVVYRGKVERLAAALADPRDRDEAADAIRGLIERIVLTPGGKRGEMHAALHGDLGTILEWAGGGRRKNATDTPHRGMSVSVVAGAEFEPAEHGLGKRGAPGSECVARWTLDFVSSGQFGPRAASLRASADGQRSGRGRAGRLPCRPSMRIRLFDDLFVSPATPWNPAVALA